MVLKGGVPDRHARWISSGICTGSIQFSIYINDFHKVCPETKCPFPADESYTLFSIFHGRHSKRNITIIPQDSFMATGSFHYQQCCESQNESKRFINSREEKWRKLRAFPVARKFTAG